MATDERHARGPDLVRLFEAFGPLYRRRVGRLLPRGIGTAQLIALAALAERGAMSMSEMRAHVGGTAQNVTGIVGTLVAEGAVRRKTDAADGRKVLIELTDETRKDVLAQREAHRCEVARLFDTLSDEERNALADMLERLIGAMREEDGHADRDR